MISKFPVITGKIEHAHTVCTRPSFLQREGPGDEASHVHDLFTFYFTPNDPIN